MAPRLWGAAVQLTLRTFANYGRGLEHHSDCIVDKFSFVPGYAQWVGCYRYQRGTKQCLIEPCFKPKDSVRKFLNRASPTVVQRECLKCKTTEMGLQAL